MLFSKEEWEELKRERTYTGNIERRFCSSEEFYEYTRENGTEEFLEGVDFEQLIEEGVKYVRREATFCEEKFAEEQGCSFEVAILVGEELVERGIL